MRAQLKSVECPKKGSKQMHVNLINTCVFVYVCAHVYVCPLTCEFQRKSRRKTTSSYVTKQMLSHQSLENLSALRQPHNNVACNRIHSGRIAQPTTTPQQLPRCEAEKVETS